MTIDSCYEGMLAKLTSQGKIMEMSMKMQKLLSNDERVLFVYNIFEDLNRFPTVSKLCKSTDTSTRCRLLGNRYYQQNNFYKAFQYYNLSLSNSPFHSDDYCTAVSNRSMVLYKLNRYKECLKDVEYVLSLKCPENLKEKLNKRKDMCLEAISKKKGHETKIDKVGNKIKMKSPNDLQYVSASNKLEVVYSKEMGRHVCAKEDINVGEVLVVEDPYLTLLLKSQYFVCCNYCLVDDLNLLPCDNCCFALYCSENCKARALKEYHSVECDLMATLFKMEFTKLELLALRTVIKARHDHSDWKSLFETIKAADASIKTQYHGHVMVENKWIYDSKYYAAIHTLSTNIERRSISDIFQKSVTAVVLLRFLKINSTFLESDCTAEQEDIFKCVAGLLLLHLMTCPTNMHGISSTVKSADGTVLSGFSVGSAAYAFLSLINHSCAPNVIRFSELSKGKKTLFALRPIKKGMQIFDNYGSHHALEDFDSRQASIKFQYKFTCICEACINKWPTYISLSMMSSNNLPLKISQRKTKTLNQETFNKLQMGDIDTALKMYSELCALCEDLDKYAPCMELCDCQEALKQCLVILEGIRTFGTDEVIDWEQVMSIVF